eukprot:gene8918-biopygen13715
MLGGTPGGGGRGGVSALDVVRKKLRTSSSHSAGRNGRVHVRSASVSLNAIVRPASGPRPLSFSPVSKVPAGEGREEEEEEEPPAKGGGGCDMDELLGVGACSTRADPWTGARSRVQATGLLQRWCAGGDRGVISQLLAPLTPPLVSIHHTPAGTPATTTPLTSPLIHPGSE